jgi:hypothetical protein
MEAMTEITAKNYRDRAAEARAKAEGVTGDSYKREWNGVAKSYDMLAVLVETHLKR